jgi:tyrosyl-tRNA synthetase
LPQISLSAEEADGLGMIAALVKVGFAKSNGEARRLIRGGGARLNDVAINDEDHVMQDADFGDGRAKISAGKKRHALIVIS